jgi:queuosine precursor transporter
MSFLTIKAMLLQNELIFILYSVVVSSVALFALKLGKEALVAYIAALPILANLFVLKQITLFHWQATASDVLMIGSVLGLNLLQEYFGKEAAKKAIWTSFLLLVFYTILCQLHLLYVPAVDDVTQPYYFALLHPMPRITIASLVTYLIAQYVDLILYGFIRSWWGSGVLVLRNYSSTIVSQLLDTVLFSFLGLYGLVDHLWQIIIVSYVVKLIAIVMVGPFVALSRKIGPLN